MIFVSVNLSTVAAFDLPVAKFIQPTEIKPFSYVVNTITKHSYAIRTTWYVESGDPKLVHCGLILPSNPNNILLVPDEWNGDRYPIDVSSFFSVNSGDQVTFVLIAPNPNDPHQNVVLDQWDQVLK